jgi:hypothetical protein
MKKWILIFVISLITMSCMSVKNTTINNLDSCIDKLTISECLMFASEPSEKHKLSDGSVIYFYKYVDLYGKRLRHEKVELNINLHFRNNVLVEWNYNGYNKFLTTPFYYHKCNGKEN